MKRYSGLYNEIKKEIYDSFCEDEILVLLSYMVLVYNYYVKGLITLEERESLFDLIHYSVKLVLERK